VQGISLQNIFPQMTCRFQKHELWENQPEDNLVYKHFKIDPSKKKKKPCKLAVCIVIQRLLTCLRYERLHDMQQVISFVIHLIKLPNTKSAQGFNTKIILTIILGVMTNNPIILIH
jgi:hypothetical protein